MIPEGYIKLWRRCLASGCWKNQKQWRVWTWCLLKATWCEIDQPVGKQMVHLLPGQFVTGRFKAVEETGLSEQEIRNQLNNLQINQQITIKSTNKYSIISIVKWQDYQEESTNKITSKTADTQPSNQPQTRSIKNNKEVKIKETIQKKVYGEFNNILLTEDEYQKLTGRFGEADCCRRIDDLSMGIASKGYKYKSHYATILSWDRLEKKRNPVIQSPEVTNTVEDYERESARQAEEKKHGR